MERKLVPILAGAAIAAVSVFLPYFKVGFVSAALINGSDGIFVLAAAALAALFAGREHQADEPRPRVLWPAILAGVFMLIYGGLDWIEQDDELFVEAGAGLYGLLLGGALIAIGGIDYRNAGPVAPTPPPESDLPPPTQ